MYDMRRSGHKRVEKEGGTSKKKRRLTAGRGRKNLKRQEQERKELGGNGLC